METTSERSVIVVQKCNCETVNKKKPRGHHCSRVKRAMQAQWICYTNIWMQGCIFGEHYVTEQCYNVTWKHCKDTVPYTTIINIILSFFMYIARTSCCLGPSSDFCSDQCVRAKFYTLHLAQFLREQLSKLMK